MADYQAMASELRAAGIRAEVYLGNPKNFGNQMKYADRRGSPLAIIQGERRSRARRRADQGPDPRRADRRNRHASRNGRPTRRSRGSAARDPVAAVRGSWGPMSLPRPSAPRPLRLRARFEAAGAMPVEADVLQPAATLLDLYGEDIRARAYVTADPLRGEQMLRPDFTVPVVQMHMANGAEPARYTYAGEVFRKQEDDPRPARTSISRWAGGLRRHRSRRPPTPRSSPPSRARSRAAGARRDGRYRHHPRRGGRARDCPMTGARRR